jgi:hypothetical protein
MHRGYVHRLLYRLVDDLQGADAEGDASESRAGLLWGRAEPPRSDLFAHATSVAVEASSIGPQTFR